MRETLAADANRLKSLWDEGEAARLADQPLDLLRYRSNLLGADLRITNFGGGNTSSKIDIPDPLTGHPVRVLAVKGSGGDLRSITSAGFAVLDLDKLESLVARYRGEAHEDEMVGLYPLCAVGSNSVAASIDTPLHALLAFAHVDHLHPDWAIALAASANGARKLEEFNARYGRHIAWVPWQRPGFELALMIRRAVDSQAGCEGIVLGSHGLFTWGDTQRDCYENSIRTIAEMGAFVDEHTRRSGRAPFGGAAVTVAVAHRATMAARILPGLRGRVSSTRCVIAHWDDSPDALTFANSAWAADLCAVGTSCPDHFLRTRISPLFVPWDAAVEPVEQLQQRVDERLERYRGDYAAYYRSFAEPDSPALRDANPSVVVIPGLGLIGFGKDKREARITTEFFLNAIQVMAGATALDDATAVDGVVPQARTPQQGKAFTSFHNYVALPRAEAFRIEYWALEEAKLQRLPPERELSRRIAVVIGGGSGIGREVSIELARLGAHVVVADRDADGAAAAWAEARKGSSPEMGMAAAVDLAKRDSIASALRATVLQFGGIDILVNTAAIFPAMDPAGASEDVWAKTLHLNVTSNHVLVDEAARVLREQALPASIVLTTSANAIVPKRGSEPYDVSKAALSHLIRELAVGLGPLVRVNGIAPATVVAGSSMFPRDRVVASLRKYSLAAGDEESTEALRIRLAEFYAARTITRRPILPIDCANAICWLAGDRSAKTTGHIIPIDGGLPDAFFR